MPCSGGGDPYHEYRSALIRIGRTNLLSILQDVLANESLQHSSHDVEILKRPNGSPVFPSTSSTVRYFMTLEAKQEVKLEGRVASVNLRWNRYNSKTVRTKREREKESESARERARERARESERMNESVSDSKGVRASDFSMDKHLTIFVLH